MKIKLFFWFFVSVGPRLDPRTLPLIQQSQAYYPGNSVRYQLPPNIRPPPSNIVQGNFAPHLPPIQPPSIRGLPPQLPPRLPPQPPQTVSRPLPQQPQPSKVLGQQQSSLQNSQLDQYYDDEYGNYGDPVDDSKQQIGGKKETSFSSVKTEPKLVQVPNNTNNNLLKNPANLQSVAPVSNKIVNTSSNNINTSSNKLQNNINTSNGKLQTNKVQETQQQLVNQAGDSNGTILYDDYYYDDDYELVEDQDNKTKDQVQNVNSNNKILPKVRFF